MTEGIDISDAPAPSRAIAWHPMLRVWLSPFVDDDARYEAYRRYIDKLDWTSVIAILKFQRLAGLCHSMVCTLPWSDELPLGFRKSCKAAWVNCRNRSSAQLSTLARVLRLTSQSAVPVMLMKGPVSVEALYGGEWGARLFRDIDIVLHEPDVQIFLDMLRAEYGESIQVRFEPRASRVHVDIGQIALEVHWDLTLFYAFARSPRRAMLQSEIWERSRTTTFPWGTCNVMCDEDVVVHLSEHAVLQHDLEVRPYLNLSDFSRAILNLPTCVDSERLIARSHNHQTPTALVASAIGVLQSFDGSERSAVIRALASPGTSGMARCVRRQLRRSCIIRKRSSLLHSGYDIVRICHVNAHFMDGLDQRLGFLREILCPSRTTLAILAGRAVGYTPYLIVLIMYYVTLFPFTAASCFVLANRQVRECLSPSISSDRSRRY